MIRFFLMVIILITLLSSFGCAQSNAKKEIFDNICQILDENFYDAEFKGID